MSVILNALKKAQKDKRQHESPRGRAADRQKTRDTKQKRRLILLGIVGVLCILIAVFYPLPDKSKPQNAMAGTQAVTATAFSPPVSSPAAVSKPANVVPEEKGGMNREMGAAAAPVDPSRAGRVPLNGFRGRETRQRQGEMTASEGKDTLGAKEGRRNFAAAAPERRFEAPPGRAGEEESLVRVSRANNEKINSLLNLALEELKAGRSQSAKDIYRDVLEHQPGNIDALNNLGVMALEEDRKQEALYYFTRILDHHKTYGKAHNNIGLVYLSEGKVNQAEESFKRAMGLDRESVEPYVNIAGIYRSQKRFEEALSMLSVPMARNAKNPALFLAYALTCDETGNYAEAKKYYGLYLQGGMVGRAERAKVIERLKYLEENRSDKNR